MEEMKIMTEGNVTVTTRRVVVGNTVTSLEDVVSAVPFKDDSWKGGAIIAGIGILVISAGGWWFLIGAGLVGGYFFWKKVRSDQILLIFEDDRHDSIKFSSNTRLMVQVCRAVNKALQVRNDAHRKNLQRDLTGLREFEQ